MDSKQINYIEGENYTEEQILKGEIFGGNGEITSLEELIEAYHNGIILPSKLFVYLSGLSDSYKLLFRQKIFHVDTLEKYNNYWKETNNIDDRYTKLIEAKYIDNYNKNK